MDNDNQTNNVFLESESSMAKHNDTDNLFDNLMKVFDLSSKESFLNLGSTYSGNAFLVGTLIFIFLMIFSTYLDSSLRNQIFYVFDNCTSEDYTYEYIVKIRFGISTDFKPPADLLIEFYNDKFKMLSKFIVNGSYLQSGLNIGTKLCPGMKISSLYLFKQNSLSHLEFCRAYLNVNDPTIMIHLYSIEVGNDREVQVFFFNHGINRSNANATQLSLVVEEPISPKYQGTIMETSYLQASIFIYFFFMLSFFLNHLMPFQDTVEIVNGLSISQSLLVNSTLDAIFCGFLYLIFRDFIHSHYASSNGSIKWYIVESLYIVFLMALFLFLAVLSVLTSFESEMIEYNYFQLVIYSNCTLSYWIPIAFLYFYLFSPSNYHLGRIIMRNTFHYAERSRTRKGQRNKAKPKKLVVDEDAESYVDESRVQGESTADVSHVPSYKEEIIRVPLPASKQLSTSQQPQTPKKFQSLKPIVYQNYENPVSNQSKDNRQFDFFNRRPSPIAYIDNQRAQTNPKNVVFQPYEMNNLDFHRNIVTPYQKLPSNMQKSRISGPTPVTYELQVIHNDDNKILQMKQAIFKRRSLEKTSRMAPQVAGQQVAASRVATRTSPQMAASRTAPQNASRTAPQNASHVSYSKKTTPISPKPLSLKKPATSKTSIASTGSDYYAAMFKDGKVKVGSISQYGSLLKEPKYS